jgi:hypothetical protein
MDVTFSLTEHRFRMLENRVFRKISGPEIWREEAAEICITRSSIFSLRQTLR